ncbi:MAG: PAS domain-containing protein [Thermoguttaceae bacterium]|nr:PAS domain-containing protein [Thermoguttaceae bacterium]
MNFELPPEERLNDAASEWQATFDAIHDLVMILDQRLRIMRMNAAVESFFQLPREKILGAHCYALMHGTRRPPETCPFAAAIESRRHEETEYFDERRNRWFRVSADPLFDRQGTLTGIVHIVSDITGRKQSEKTLRTLAGKLLTAREAECRRLAREMHDDLTQRIAAVAVEVGRLSQEPDIVPGVSLRLQAIESQLINLSSDMHALSRQLHPAILDDLGLVEALRSECDGLGRREGITVEFSATGSAEKLSKETTLALYRIAQEGLRNIARHAGVAEASLSLAVTEQGALLSIEDEGVGFDSARVHRRAGIGLDSMEERARLIGGDLSIRTAPGRGTLIEVWAPLASGETS